nr:MAG TPA: hypothetical protein [Caudoviricetes sp.]
MYEKSRYSTFIKFSVLVLFVIRYLTIKYDNSF